MKIRWIFSATVIKRNAVVAPSDFCSSGVQSTIHDDDWDLVDFEVSSGAAQRRGRARIRGRNRIANGAKPVDVFMTGRRATARPDRRGLARPDRVRDVASRCCVAPGICGPVSPAHDKSPVAVRASIAYRRGYFNILKFHPKRALYQNLRHKLRAATRPLPSASTLTFCIPLGVQIGRCRTDDESV